MIICPDRGFVFVHVPKCAGSSVRDQIARCDGNSIALHGIRHYPGLGEVDTSHIRMNDLRRHVPEAWAALQNLDSFAILRDPLPRFGSALRQMLWKYEQRPMTLIPAEELRAKTVALLPEIEAQLDAPTPRMVYFARQVDFIAETGAETGENIMVDHLIPLELVSAFVGYLSRRTGTPMDTETRANQNVDLRFKRAGALAYRVNGFLRERLPGGLHARIKNAALAVLSSRGSAAESAGILEIPEVRAFVERHYARDYALYGEVMANRDRLARQLAEDSLPRRAG